MGLLRDDGQQQMRGPLSVVIDLVQRGLLLQMWLGTYSALVAPPTPVGMSALMISRQMRWPRRNRFAVAMISMA